MALELIAALIAAATVGLMAWALRRWLPGLPQWFIPVYGFARWQNPQSGLMVFYCAQNRSTPVTEGVDINKAGQLTGGEWVATVEKDALQEAACREG